MESQTLSHPLPSAAAGAPLRVGWLVATQKIQSASVRYRCFHMARVLAHSGILSTYFTDAETLAQEIGALDALIVVKRLDPGVIRAAAAAARFGKRVYLDLCDDLLSERYAKNPDGVNGLIFAAIAPHLAAVTVPSAAMATRMRARMAQLVTTPPPVHVIPDIAETRTLFHLTERFLGQEPAPAGPPLPAADGGRAQVLWFGNFGAPHSNFGIFSLLPVLPALAAVHRDLPLELVVVSNNKSLFGSMTEGCGFPTRYLTWTPQAVYDALEQADLVISTSGTDDFCSVKSSNRPLQALAAGVPVISDPSLALTEFADIVMIGKFEQNLRRCLGMDPGERYERFIAPAQPLLERYSPQALAGLWRQLLLSSPAGSAEAAPRPAVGQHRVMFLVELGTKAAALGLAMKSARKAGLDREVLMPVAAAAQTDLRHVVQQARLIPRVFTDTDKMAASVLADVDVLALAGPEGPAGAELRLWADRSGIPVVDTSQSPPSWAAFLPKIPAPPTARPNQPGPHPETLKPDGRTDWLFVVHPNNQGWILDAISREIGSRQTGRWSVAYNPPKLPLAQTYFFTHYSLFHGALRKSPDQLAQAKSLIWYTHPRNEGPAMIAALLDSFAKAHRVIFTCTAHRDLWLARGLAPEKAAMVLGGADPALFTGHARGAGVIGLSASFYERKNPDTLRDLVAMLPHRRFHLVGRNWEQYALFGLLESASNFQYHSHLPYSAYPEVYKGFDVFLSLSKLEGGPIPLLEAMMENAVPVVSRTGFAPDLIRHGENGYLFDIDAAAEEIAPLIETAFESAADIRATVLEYDWDQFAQKIAALAE